MINQICLNKRVVTVLIATFNHALYITEALQSVNENAIDLRANISQPIHIEVVIMDDGSTDETEQVINKFQKEENVEIKYRFQSNQGQPAAYENAVPFITGEIVFLLDSDDIFLPEKIRKTLEVFDRYPEVGLVAHPLYVIDSQGTSTGEIRPKAAKISHGDIREIVKKYGRNVAPATTGLAFRSDLFREIHPTPLKGIPSAADSYLSFAAAFFRPVYNLSEPLAKYRQHASGMYIKRMTSIAGLERTFEIQKRILARFGLENTLKNNSYFMRNVLALYRMEKPMKNWISILFHLNGAILSDPFLPALKKIAFLLYWDFAAILPKKMFWRCWLTFQKIQTGLRNF